MTDLEIAERLADILFPDKARSAEFIRGFMEGIEDSRTNRWIGIETGNQWPGSVGYLLGSVHYGNLP